MEVFSVGDEVSVEHPYYTDPGIVAKVSVSGRTIQVSLDHGETMIFAYCEKVEKFVRQGVSEFEAVEAEYLVKGRTKSVSIPLPNSFYPRGI